MPAALILSARIGNSHIFIITENALDFLFKIHLAFQSWLLSPFEYKKSGVRQCHHSIRCHIRDFGNKRIFISISSDIIINLILSDRSKVIETDCRTNLALFDIKHIYRQFLRIVRQCDIHRKASLFCIKLAICKLISLAVIHADS